MREGLRRWGWHALAMGVLVGVASTAVVTPAAAQLSGPLRYVWGFTLVPNQPLSNAPTTLILYGNYPTGCGEVQSASVTDIGHVSIGLRAKTCVDTSGGGNWEATFSLGRLAAGTHTVAISLTMDRPDSGVTVHEGSVTFGVQDSGAAPPAPIPTQPPLPPVLLERTTTDPWPPSPDRPMALILSGRAPFGCPVVTAATVVDSSHLALTLSPSYPCSDTLHAWSQRFELGFQREGWHLISVTFTLAGDSVETVVKETEFLVVHDTTGWGPPPPDSLQNVLSGSRPNPFVQETRFSVSTDGAADADVAVFDVLGRRVSSVFHGRLPSGTTELKWNGRRDDGTRAVAGVYFYRLEMRGHVVSRRLILLRQP